MVFNPHQFPMQLAAESHEEFSGHNWERAALEQNSGEKSLGREYLKVVFLLKVPCPHTMVRVSYLGPTLSTRSP